MSGSYDVVALALKIGSLDQQIRSFENDSPREDEVLAAQEQKLLDATKILIHLTNHMCEAASTLNGVAHTIFQFQLGQMNKKLEEIVSGTVRKIFDKRINPQIEELDQAVQALSQKVDECVSSKNLSQAQQLFGERQKLLKRFLDLKYFGIGSAIHFDDAHMQAVKRMESMLRTNMETRFIEGFPREFENLIYDDFAVLTSGQPSKNEAVKLIDYIQGLIDQKPIALTKNTRREFNFRIEALKGNVSNFLDGQIYALAPEPKGGPRWGYIHRFDDLNRLKQALVIALSQDFDAWLQTESILKDRPEAQQIFYRLIYEHSGVQPEVADPVLWAKQNIVYNLERISSALQEAKFAIDHPEDSDEEDDVSSDHEACPLDTGELLGGGDNAATFLQLKKLLKLPVSEEIKKRVVKEHIKVLPPEVRNPLYGRIWDLAVEYRHKEPRWGEIHCVDNLVILEQAIAMQSEGARRC